MKVLDEKRDCYLLILREIECLYRMTTFKFGERLTPKSFMVNAYFQVQKYLK